MTSVLIPVYNGAHVLHRTVPAVLAMEGVEEWVWVDDGSTDATAGVLHELLQHEPRARVVRHSTNRGRGAARNSAAHAASGHILVFLDADARPPPEAALQLAQSLDPADVVAVTGRVRPVLDQPDDPYQRYLAQYPRGAPDVGVAEPLPWRFFLSCVCALRRDTFESVGGFDPDIAYGEDFALACRLRQRAPDGLRRADTTVDLFDAPTVHGALRNVESFGRALRQIERSCPDALQVAGMGKPWRGPAGRTLGRLAPSVGLAARVLSRIPPPLQPWAVRYVLGLALLSSYYGARPDPS